MIFIDEADGFGFRSAFKNSGGTAQRKILDQDHTVAVVQHGAMGILDHSGGVRGFGLRRAFPFMAAGETLSFFRVIHHIGHLTHGAGRLAHETGTLPSGG